MIKHGITGLLVPPGDEGALASAMLSLCSDPERAKNYGKAARERAMREFSRDRQLRELIGVIERGFDSHETRRCSQSQD
jgi:rhamnosyl/mannosyltransferase